MPTARKEYDKITPDKERIGGSASVDKSMRILVIRTSDELGCKICGISVTCYSALDYPQMLAYVVSVTTKC